jgi:hypothetical protein
MRLSRLLSGALVITCLGVMLTGCGPDQSGQSGQSGQISDDSIVSQIGDWATSWLRELTPPGSEPLSCPNEIRGSYVASDSGNARACLWGMGYTVYLRVQNLTRVPLTVEFANTWITLKPTATDDYPLISPSYNQVVHFQTDLRAAATFALTDLVKKTVSPFYEWTTCISGLSVDCLLGVLKAVIPEAGLLINDVVVPATRILSLVQQFWDYSPLVSAFNDQIQGNGQGTLTFERFCLLIRCY